MKYNKSQFFDTREETKRWLDKYNIKNYIINDDLSVDVNGHVNIAHNDLEFMPVNFVTIIGNFWCHDNRLITLIGSPKTVRGNFNCGNNRLVSLAGSPKSVGAGFWCNDNKLTTLKGSPKSINFDFNCSNNHLTSLAGAPKSVGGSLRCNNNFLASLIEIIDCYFKEKFFFSLDKKNFKQKELIKILEKYYNSKYEFYELTNHQFRDTLKPQIEKEILQDKLINSKIKNKIRTSFL